MRFQEGHLGLAYSQVLETRWNHSFAADSKPGYQLVVCCDVADNLPHFVLEQLLALFLQDGAAEVETEDTVHGPFIFLAQSHDGLRLLAESLHLLRCELTCLGGDVWQDPCGGPDEDCHALSNGLDCRQDLYGRRSGPDQQHILARESCSRIVLGTVSFDSLVVFKARDFGPSWCVQVSSGMNENMAPVRDDLPCGKISRDNLPSALTSIFSPPGFFDGMTQSQILLQPMVSRELLKVRLYLARACVHRRKVGLGLE